MKRHIVIFSYNNIETQGGVERLNYILARRFREEYIVTVIDKSCIPKSVYIKRIGWILYIIFSTIHYFKVRNTHSVRYVLSNAWFSPFISTNVVLAHGSLYRYNKIVVKKRLSGTLLFSFFEALTYRYANYLAVVSKYVEKCIREDYYIKKNKCVVINPGIELESLSVRQAKCKCNQIIRFGFAGRLEDAKGLKYLVDICSEITNHKNVSINICTNSCNIDILPKNDQVKITTGLVGDSMAEFYSDIDILILPSKFEGFELVTLEAIAAGAFVLGNPVGACRELREANFPQVDYLPVNARDLLKDASSVYNRFLLHMVSCEDLNKFQDYYSGARYANDILKLLCFSEKNNII